MYTHTHTNDMYTCICLSGVYMILIDTGRCVKAFVNVYMNACVTVK